VKAGRPLVVRIFVPLCSNDQIDCGAPVAGKPGDLDKNLYWGAAFGLRHFFDRKGSGWERVSVAQKVSDAELERVVYRRWAAGEPWGREGNVEEIVVASAMHGDRIDDAVAEFWATATRGGQVTIADGDAERTLRVSVVGYTGHDRLMDGLRLPEAKPSADAIPSFVLACYSDRYFGGPLRAAGSETLVTTRALMAPEAYTVDALLVAIGDRAPVDVVRRRAIAAYAKWQRISESVATKMFVE
jgi:hypothetical protein